MKIRRTLIHITFHLSLVLVRLIERNCIHFPAVVPSLAHTIHLPGACYLFTFRVISHSVCYRCITSASDNNVNINFQLMRYIDESKCKKKTRNKARKSVNTAEELTYMYVLSEGINNCDLTAVQSIVYIGTH